MSPTIEQMAEACEFSAKIEDAHGIQETGRILRAAARTLRAMQVREQKEQSSAAIPLIHANPVNIGGPCYPAAPYPPPPFPVKTPVSHAEFKACMEKLPRWDRQRDGLTDRAKQLQDVLDRVWYELGFIQIEREELKATIQSQARSVAAAEARAHELEHAIWHALDDSEERNDCQIITRMDADILSKLVPFEHPAALARPEPEGK